VATRRRSSKRDVEHYEHANKTRLNNPPAGLVNPETDPELGATKKTYQYDPHLDPQLVWAGKAEHMSFEVPTVSLHVHERIDPLTIIEAVRRRNGQIAAQQLPLFETQKENPPLREAIDFYKHKHGWSNRLVLGDSLLVMNSLLEKEGMAGQVQMVYLDPPYGIKYGSNFQPFVNKRDVRDGRDEDLNQEPEQIRAFRDTWELGIHSYLAYLRDRLLLARELLTESGSIFVQINAENVHHLTQVMSEVFGEENLIANIVFRKKSIPLGAKYIETMHDHLVMFAKDRAHLKYRHLFEESDVSSISSHGPYALYPDGSCEKIEPTQVRSPDHLKGTRYYRLFSLLAPSYTSETDFPYELDGVTYPPPSGGCWVTSKEKLDILAQQARIQPEGRSLSYRLFFEDFPYKKITASWQNVGVSYTKIYAVQTSPSVIQRCVLMTTDPGDLVLDPTCGSGTTAYVAEQWGRRWITCDTSRVSITLAKQRVMSAVFDYYELAHPEEGVSSGFRYKTVPHVTLKSIANNPEIKPGMTRQQIDQVISKYAEQETLYDQPIQDRNRARVTGPFTVEAVPAPVVRPLYETPEHDQPGPIPAAGQAVARSGETARQRDWRDELLKTGIRGKAGQRIQFSRIEPLPGTRWLHADAETKVEKPERVVVSFGPEHGPLDQRQVTLALEEAQTLVPRPRLVIFAAFEFDPEAAKDIDETNWPGVTLLKAKMNSDLLTEDLKKKRASNDSFWLVGQPDVELRHITSGQDKGQWQVEVRGFDYFNTRTGELVSGGTSNIAMWLLDNNYDGRSLYPRQVFFPMADDKGGWARLTRTLRAEIDEDAIEQYRGTVSLPFELGGHKRVAVKIVDDRGIECLKVIRAE
jgi:adenine-specific DNA-methyltransferase